MDSERSTHVIEHPTMGRIRGVRSSDFTVQFLGIRYGTLEDRFSQGEQVKYPSFEDKDGGITINATKFGPTPLITPDACTLEQKMIQKTLPFSGLPISDTLCLTLNITVPEIPEGNRVPVLAFVHGGGYTSGSNSFPQNDMTRITELSVKAGAPIVSVGINYRVAAPGFLYSPEMEAAGYKANNGLADQQLAFRWIKDNIAGFGGDPTRVTYLGESAGAWHLTEIAAGFYHLHSPEPFFDQLIAMSGTSLLRPRTTEAVRRSFQLICEALGAEYLDPQEKVQKIMATSSEDFVAQTGRKYALGPIVDGYIIPKITTYESTRAEEDFLNLYPSARRCKRIFVGDCQMDGIAWASRIAQRTDVYPKTLEKCLATIFDPIDKEVTSIIINGYNLDTSIDSNTPETTQSVLDFCHDITFYLGASHFANVWSSNPSRDAFLYHFNCPNAWDGPWKGHATHALDIMFVLQNYREHLAPAQRVCAEKFAMDVIQFVNGRNPWPPVSTEGCRGVMVYDAPMVGEKDESMFVVDGSPEQTKRRNILRTLVKEEHYDNLFEAWRLFMNFQA